MKRKKKEKVTFQREGMIRKEKGRGERCNETRWEDAKKRDDGRDNTKENQDEKGDNIDIMR